MWVLILISSLFAAGNALVCTPELCANAVQEPLNCPGSVIKKGGFCGCTDVCAMQENEECQAHYHFGIIPAGKCDDGLTCVENSNGPMAFGRGICVKSDSVGNRRAVPETLTTCQQMKRIRMISMVVWRGMWTPKCDSEGKFEPQQCDNMKRCFCVDVDTGVVDNSTMVQGPASCPDATHQTKCQQMYAIRQISFVIWEGMWVPKCDRYGNFEPQQCDNTGHCFCVTAKDGIVDETTKVLGAANCITHKRELTKCMQMKNQVSFVIYQGMWTPKCDEFGNFEPEQCDNTGHCFCVTAKEGVVDKSSKVYGSARCITSKREMTKCLQMRNRVSLVIWQGMWTPKCDLYGHFLPEQCDNTGRCFCVDRISGIVDESTKVLGSATCY